MENLIHFLILKLSPSLSQMTYSIEHFISILASIGTLMAAIVALWTVGVMKRQMHSTYLPEIFVSADHSNAIIIKEDSEDIYRRIACFYDTGGLGEKNGLRVILNNVGLGAAKNIIINWNFDHESVIKNIDRILVGTEFRMKLSSSKKTIYIQDSYLDTLYLVDIRDIHKSRLDYVLPIKDGPFDLFPLLPSPITELYTLFFLCKSNLLTANDDEAFYYSTSELFEDFPELTVLISYQDIAGNQFDKTFKVTPFINRKLVALDNSESSKRNELHLNFFLSFTKI